MGEMKVMSVEGDVKVVWDPSNDDEVDAAEDQFNSLMKKGFSAYSVKKDGDKGRRVEKFDPKLESLIMVPEIVGG